MENPTPAHPAQLVTEFVGIPAFRRLLANERFNLLKAGRQTTSLVGLASAVADGPPFGHTARAIPL
jgi:hypothetical protein